MFGLNVVLRDGGEVFRTYFVNGRGVEAVGPTWTLLDLTPVGRQKTWETSPAERPQGDPWRGDSGRNCVSGGRRRWGRRRGGRGRRRGGAGRG